MNLKSVIITLGAWAAIILFGASDAKAAIAFVSASATSCAQTTASVGVACTLAGTTTAGNVVIVGLSWRTVAVSLSKVVGSATNSWFVIYTQAPYQCNGNTAGTCSAILVCLDCAALTTVTPTFSATTKYVLNVAEYSGIDVMGITGTNTGTSASPTISLTTGDANDWIVTEFGDAGSATPTSNTGNLRKANNTGATGIAGALVDNTASSAGSVTTSVTITSAAYSASSVELRTTYAKTYIWPDCDSTHPCLIHHKSTQQLDLSDTLTTPFYIHLQPSLANNLIKLTITHPSGSTISSVTDNNSQTWSSGKSITDSTDTTMVDVRFVCGATAGTSGIGITLSNTVASGSLMGVEADEYSGIATSSCERTNSGQLSTTRGTVQPGSMTVTSGDLIYAFYVDATGGQQNGYPSGWFMPDDSSALIWEDMFNNMAASQSVAGSTSVNPTIYANSYATTLADERTFILGEAFKASSGSGTQPPSTTAWVVRDVMYRNDQPAAAYRPITAFPTNGNAFVIASSVFQTANSLTNLTDNQGSTFEVNTVTDTSGDAQQLIVCLGSGGGVVRDRAISWTLTGTNDVPLEMYDIAGAKQSSGSGCIGTMKNHGVGSVASGTCTGSLTGQCANIVSNSSQFSTVFTFAPTLNGTASSVVVMTGALSQGPPAAACDSGGQTPPTCNGTMGLTAATTGVILGAASATSGFVFSSIWASGMTDSSHYSNGDEYGYYYTNSTTAQSMDFWSANSNASGGTGASTVNLAGVEILGQASATTAARRLFVIR
jgi:hypothetical protein